MFAYLANTIWTLGVIEDILRVLEKRNVQVHAGTGNTKYGLGHKRGVQTMLLGYSPNYYTEGYNTISRA